VPFEKGGQVEMRKIYLGKPKGGMEKASLLSPRKRFRPGKVEFSLKIAKTV